MRMHLLSFALVDTHLSRTFAQAFAELLSSLRKEEAREERKEARWEEARGGKERV